MAGKKITAYKGFDSDLSCRGFKYEIGKTYKHEGKVEKCDSGFHACGNPLDVFGYYPPTGRFAQVELSGKMDIGDDKIAAAKITITAEMNLPDFIKKGVDFILSKVDFKNAKESNAGYQSAATNTGDRSAATNTGYQSAATNTGDRSAATNTGDQSAATNTGYQSAAEVSGKASIAIASGREGRAKAAAGCAIVLCEYDDDGGLINVKSGIAGKTRGVKPGTWYTLQNNKFVEVK